MTPKDLQDEIIEQARLNGMGSEREARLLAQVTELQREVQRLTAALQELQSKGQT